MLLFQQPLGNGSKSLTSAAGARARGAEGPKGPEHPPLISWAPEVFAAGAQPQIPGLRRSWAELREPWKPQERLLHDEKTICELSGKSLDCGQTASGRC